MRSVIKYVVFLVLLSGAFYTNAQPDFFKLYRQVSELQARLDKLVPVKVDLTVADSTETEALQKRRNTYYADSMPPVLKHLNNLTFPDISFTDKRNKDHALSDFAGSELVINYTYLYCMSCVHRIDSTLKRTAAKNVKMLVLVSDRYKKDLDDLDHYGDKIITGLVNDDTCDLIAMKQGDDCMYYLNANRQIEFFDKAVSNHREAWLDFLDQHVK